MDRVSPVFELSQRRLQQQDSLSTRWALSSESQAISEKREISGRNEKRLVAVMSVDSPSWMSSVWNSGRRRRRRTMLKISPTWAGGPWCPSPRSGPMGKWPLALTLDTRSSGEQGTLGQGTGSWCLIPIGGFASFSLVQKPQISRASHCPESPSHCALPSPVLVYSVTIIFKKIVLPPSFHHQSY